MTALELFLLGTTTVLVVLLGLLVKAYLPAYVKEKAKNLATKEDIADITNRVERVRAEISKESALLEKRREVYERISDALRVFIAGHAASEVEKEEFHAAYSAGWLWAPDQVSEKLNGFIRMQQENTANPGAHTQDEMKQAYGEIILGMRKDAGFPETQMHENEYLFVRF